MIMEMLGQPREETREEELEREVGYYKKEMTAKEERIRQLKKKHAKEIEEWEEKYHSLENKYNRLKGRKVKVWKI